MTVLVGMVVLCQNTNAQQLPNGIPTVTTITPGSLYRSHPNSFNSGIGVTFAQPTAPGNRVSVPLPKSGAGGQTQKTDGTATASKTALQSDPQAGKTSSLTTPLQQSLSVTGSPLTSQGASAAMPVVKPLQPPVGVAGSAATASQTSPTMTFSIAPIALQSQQAPSKAGASYVPMSSSPLVTPLSKPLSTPVQQPIMTTATPQSQPQSVSTTASSPQPATSSAAKP